MFKLAAFVLQVSALFHIALFDRPLTQTRRFSLNPNRVNSGLATQQLHCATEVKLLQVLRFSFLRVNLFLVHSRENFENKLISARRSRVKVLHAWER